MGVPQEKKASKDSRARRVAIAADGDPLQGNTQKFNSLSVCNGADRICKLARQRVLSWPES